jgi:CBS domain-containing protein
MSDIRYRPAAIGDAADIHALLLAVAGDIPLAVETLEQEETLYAAVRKMLAFGQSWVAVEDEGIVGFVLVDSAEVGRHWGENELLNLRYAAGERLDELIGKVLERDVPITASVRDANRTGLAELLRRLGFRQAETRVGETHFRREP